MHEALNYVLLIVVFFFFSFHYVRVGDIYIVRTCFTLHAGAPRAAGRAAALTSRIERTHSCVFTFSPFL